MSTDSIRPGSSINAADTGNLGGRTAWSATVTIKNENLAAKFWYDGQFLNNAKEDAAEVAVTKIMNPAITQSRGLPPTYGQQYSRS